MTDDDVGRGSNQNNWMGMPYQSVVQPCHVETVIALLPTGPGRELQKWKYSRYFDNVQFWTSPGSSPRQDVVTIVNGPQNQAGSKTADTTVKTTPAADQTEVDNLGADPLELTNLAGSTDPAIAAVIAQLASLLAETGQQEAADPPERNRRRRAHLPARLTSAHPARSSCLRASVRSSLLRSRISRRRGNG